MEDINVDLIKVILTTIKLNENYGFEIFSIIKNNNSKLNHTLLYTYFKVLSQLGYITTYKNLEENNCCVKIYYKLTEKGYKYLESMNFNE